MKVRSSVRTFKKVRTGFTLAEVMVAVAIMAIIASVFIPSLLSYLDTTRAESAKTSIDSVMAGVVRFRTAITKYPSALNMLTDSIRTSGVAGGLNSRNSCTGYATASGFFTTTEVTSWRTQGPFFTMPIATDGYPIGIGTMNNSIVRSPSTGTGTTSAALLFFSVPNVRTEDIDALELLYDATSNSSTGTIRWSASANGYATLSYVMAMRGC